jgi:hypothetical protein
MNNMFVAFDRAGNVPMQFKCKEDDGEVRIALLAGDDPDALKKVLAELFGDDWAYGGGGYPPRFDVQQADVQKIARELSLLWRYDGGQRCVLISQGEEAS